jgi:hypothetical protein
LQDQIYINFEKTKKLVKQERKLQVTAEILTPILIAVATLITAGLVTWFAFSMWRSHKLREKFGAEYDYTLEKAKNRRAAEDALAEREKRVGNLDTHSLRELERDRYHGEWITIQANFVDDPSKSIEDANRLITEVMIARGFPVADFEQRAADLSVLYPEFVSNYRMAYAVALKNQSSGASTEELRQAMVYYRSLFNELLEIEEVVVYE